MRPSAILIDVGFTLTFCDGETIAELARAAGVEVAPEALHGAERVLRAELHLHGWASRPDSLAPPGGGPRFFSRMLELAGASGPLDDAARAIWDRHLTRNVWRRVEAGTAEALARLRAAGLRLAAVSNSEGTVEAMLADVGLKAHLDAIVDSWVAGVAKPDPRIYALALARLGAHASQAIMVGDSPAADVDGALAAGLAGAVLIDPYDFHPSARVPRYARFADFVDAFLLAGGA